jgi:glycosyltransferase involved in cell wall biosynthesis
MLNADSKAILVVTAYNESRNIDSLIKQIGTLVNFIVVVDDGSRDGTAAIAKSSLERNSHNFIVLTHLKNTGQGGARTTGALFAVDGRLRDENVLIHSQGGKPWQPTEDAILIFTDGDGQLDPCEIPAFLKKLRNSSIDFVKGDRFATPDLLRVMPKTRLLGNVLLSAITKLASGYWDLTDSQCGYFAMKLELAAKLDWRKLRTGYGQINDIVIRLNELDARVSSIPVKAIYGIGEISGIRIHKVALPIFMTCLKGFYRRILIKNTIWKTHPLAAFYIFGHILVFISIVFGSKILFGISNGDTAPPLTSILVMILGTLGILSIFQAVFLDLVENRRLYVSENE